MEQKKQSEGSRRGKAVSAVCATAVRASREALPKTGIAILDSLESKYSVPS